MKKAKQVTPGPQEYPPHLHVRERQMNEDYEWCLNDKEVRRKYGGKVVVAYRRRIWGAGKDQLAAWSAAQRKQGCPSKGHAATVVVPDYFPEDESA